jgi:hypothetical protein
MAYKNPPKETQFTSENQPSPEKKRVKHYKTRLKKFFIEKGIDKLIKIAEMGDINKSVTLRAIEDVKEWVYGKEVDKVEVNSTNKTIIEILVEELSKNNEIPKDD